MPNAEPKKFRFTLIIRDVVTKVLNNAPDGWLKTKITYKPDSFYKGIRRTLTAPYTYVKIAAYLLRQEWYTFAGLGRGVLQVDRLVPKTWDYENIYLGKINFTTGKDKQTGWQADTSTNDFTTRLDAYDTKPFLIPLEGNDILDITLPSLSLKENADFIMYPSRDFRANAFFDMRVVGYQQNATIASVHDVGFFADATPDFSTSGEWFFHPTITTKVRVYGSMDIATFEGFGQPNRNLQINFFLSDDTEVKRIFDQPLHPVDLKTYHIDFDFVTNVAAGQSLFLYFNNTTDNNSDVGIGFQMIKGEVHLEYNTASPASKCKGVRAYDVFQRLLQLMNINQPFGANQPVPNQSYLLNKALPGNVFGNLVYTCSDAIRAGNTTNTAVGTIYQAGDTLEGGGRYLVLGSEITYNGVTYEVESFFDYVLGQDSFDAPDGNGFVKQIFSTPSLVMSFKKDFFQDILSLMGGSAICGVDKGVVYLEDLPYGFRPGSGSLNLGIVDTKTQISLATDLQYNSFKGGYKNQEYDQINGLAEVNSEVTYISDLLDPSAELNIQASSRADPTGIEIARVVGVDSAASRSKNDNFMIVIKDTPEEDGSYKPVQMDALQAFSGVDPSYYNWFITPKQNFLRGGRYLRSIFDKMDGYSLRLSAPLRNVNLVTVDDNGVRVGEKDDVMIGAGLGEQIFIPWYAQVNCKLPFDAADLIDMNMFSDIAFTWNDNLLKGFPAEINVDESQNSPQTFKLLLTPANKTVDLIR